MRSVYFNLISLLWSAVAGDQWRDAYRRFREETSALIPNPFRRRAPQ